MPRLARSDRPNLVPPYGYMPNVWPAEEEEPPYEQYYSKTFEDIHLSAHEYELAEEIFAEVYSDGRVQQVLSDFEVRGDKFTLEHLERAAWASLILAIRVGTMRGQAFSRERLAQLYFGMIVHDLGKLYMQALIHSSEPLSEASRELINRHPQIGVDMAASYGITDPVVVGIIGNHHRGGNPSYGAETGFPDGDQDPELEQIGNVGDVWDAMCSQRPYPSSFALPSEARPRLRELKVDDDILLAFDSLLEPPQLRQNVEAASA